MVAFHGLLTRTERVSLRPVPPRCACVRCAGNGRPADVSASPGQDVLRARHALLPAHARIPCSTSLSGARGSRFEEAARAHRRIYPPTPSPCSTMSGERSAGGTRQCPPHPAAVCGARYTLFAHVTVRPRYALSGFAAAGRLFAPPTRSGSPGPPLVTSLIHSFAPRVWS